MAACSDSSTGSPTDTSGSGTTGSGASGADTPPAPQPGSSPTASAAVDDTLEPRTIAVVAAGDHDAAGAGEVRATVGVPLEVRISADLAEAVESIGWHRCIQVPACETIAGATSATYTPTDDDAWHVLRIIVVRADPSGSKAVEARVGPVARPEPRPFDERIDAVTTGGIAGAAMIIGPGPLEVAVTAPCAVEVALEVETASIDDDGATATAESEAPAETHRFSIASDGGRLRVVVIGECDGIVIEVAGLR